MSRLLSCSPLAIREVAEALDEHIPPATVTNPQELATEEGRLRIAQRAGRREVVEMLRLAFKKQQETT